MRAFAVDRRREMAETAVKRRGVSIALAVRAFGASETCCRSSPKLKDGTDVIADLLTGLTDARKTWGFGLYFLHLRNVKGHPWNHKRVYRTCCELELKLRIWTAAIMLPLAIQNHSDRTFADLWRVFVCCLVHDAPSLSWGRAPGKRRAVQDQELVRLRRSPQATRCVVDLV